MGRGPGDIGLPPLLFSDGVGLRRPNATGLLRPEGPGLLRPEATESVGLLRPEGVGLGARGEMAA